jgi:hypothetical protein
MCILMVDVDRLLRRVFELRAGVIDFWKGVPNDVVQEFRMILIWNVGRNPNNYGGVMCETDVAFEFINRGQGL